MITSKSSEAVLNYKKHIWKTVSLKKKKRAKLVRENIIKKMQPDRPTDRHINYVIDAHWLDESLLEIVLWRKSRNP